MTLQEQIRANRLRTAVVLLGFGFLVAALVVGVAGLYDPGIAGVVGIAAIAYGVFSYFSSGKIIAAASGAHPSPRPSSPSCTAPWRTPPSARA